MIKMILESAQIMSTVQREYWNMADDDLYKSTHKNHPCVKWVSENSLHYLWLFEHFEELCKIYKEKFGKDHKTWKEKRHVLYKPIFYIYGTTNPRFQYDLRLPTFFANCSRYKDEPNVFEAYKKTLQEKWEEDAIKVQTKRKPNAA
jgi:hypothetical protein